MKTSNRGLRINFVRPGSPAYKAGLRRGDTVVSAGGEGVSDSLEFLFFTAQPRTVIQTVRGDARRDCIMLRPGGVSVGVAFREPPIIRCRNRCIFCFIDQMPRGLRKSLYVKDEDYRHSFANGNYVTLSNTSPPLLRRIAEMGLSPLYISVHATDRRVRRTMLGNPRTCDIMPQLRFLEKSGIRFHTQIVVCPGINNGKVLKRTIHNLLSLRQGLLSIAVVPVGLTRHRSIPLAGVEKREAALICKEVGLLSDRHAADHGKRLIFCADELFIKAGFPIPAAKYYEDFPQIENGVGLIRQLLDDWRRIKKRLVSSAHNVVRTSSKCSRRRILIVTSVSAYGFIKKIVDERSKMSMGAAIDVKAISNLFFGETVTVAGLLTARDIVRTVRPLVADYGCVVLPNVMFNTRGHTLDGYSKNRIEKQLGLPVKVVGSIGEIFGKILGKQ
jgi:putative radical SAM enzyme (TIGR03279 family)